MPCSDGGQLEASNATYYRKLEQRCGELAQMLCWMCGEVTLKSEIDIAENFPLHKWWIIHQEEDTRRVTKEMQSAVHNFKSANTLAQSFINDATKIHKVSTYHEKWFYALANKIYDDFKKQEKKKDEKVTIRKAALAKLTDKEKEILKLNG